MLHEPGLVGIDGCRAGWIAVTQIEGELRVELWDDLEPLFCKPWDSACVDIPIGLKFGTGRRDCDQAARDLLGKQRSSIFFAPPRQHLEATDYEQVRSHGLSLQSFYLLPKIREMDRRIEPKDQSWLREAHPELSYRTQAQGELESKKTQVGREQRQALLRTIGSPLYLDDWASSFRRREVALDDLLDAAILLEVARSQAAGRGRSVRDPLPDPKGLSMEICF